MTSTEAKAFRKALESKRTELGNRTTNRDALAVDTSSDELDRIQHAAERDYAIGNLERTLSRLREVSAALRRLDEGTFGVCGRCEEEIDTKRLTAVPWASKCIVCQEAADHEQECEISQTEEPLALAV